MKKFTYLSPEAELILQYQDDIIRTSIVVYDNEEEFGIPSIIWKSEP